MLVAQILNSKPSQGVLTIEPGKTVADAAAMLSAKRIGSLVVSKTGEDALGILSERDIVREVGKRGTTCLADSVDDMMTSKLVSCSPDASAEQVLNVMTEKRFRHMPVMDGDKMVGLVTLGDVVKAQLQTLSMEKEALEGMIMGY
ncbi:MAG: CBS domain-containing protein [Halocynthiibacter sp.]